MIWSKLLNDRRLGDDPQKPPSDRSEFQRDYDRIIFWSAFRRLQGKTQVFPLPEIDPIHNRLTHSLEVASVGRSLGQMTGRKLNSESECNLSESFAEIVGAACLAHDIGNPPFGHSGEKAISNFFSDQGKQYIKCLSFQQQKDFLHFEGNALGFRILTHSKPSQVGGKGGLRLTYATLGAFTKYPRGSTDHSNKNKASEKKFLFQSDLETFAEVASKLNLKKKGSGEKWYRHPLAFLVEAADDICYEIIDLEDGYRLKLISFEETSDLLKKIATQGAFRQERYDEIKHQDRQIEYLRAVSIDALIQQAADVFVKNVESILSGKFDHPLLDEVEAKLHLEKIRENAKQKLYAYRPVVEIEAAGFEVLAGLLDAFLNSVKGTNSRQRKYRDLLPDEYLDVNREPFKDGYEQVMSITEFVAGMTDTFAIDTYRVIKGISLRNY